MVWTVDITGNSITVTGKLGTNSLQIIDGVKVEIDNNAVCVKPAVEEKAKHCISRFI